MLAIQQQFDFGLEPGLLSGNFGDHSFGVQ